MKILIISLCALLACLGTIACSTTNGDSMNKKNVYILLGPPGSGKGTQAKKLSEKLSLPHISTGDLFRENLRQGTALGNKVKQYLDSGNLVPDSIVIDMLLDRVKSQDCEKGYLLDGFPRSIPQAEALGTHLGDAVNVVVLNLDVSDDVIVKRIEGRLSCKNCGAVYNKYFNPPKADNTCDTCGGELVHRSDDNAEVVQERLNVYHKQTAPLEQYYSAKGKVVTVDGTQEPTKVFSELIDATGSN